jgi:outer membrane protein OmpA-like peptidoglycan-associated protein
VSVSVKTLGAAGATVAGALALWSCSSTPPRTDTAVVLTQQNNAFYQEQLQRAREALARQEWNAAQENLEALVEALPPQDPTGAEARAGLAQIAFELGNYTRAVQVAGEVPAGGAHSVQAMEFKGLAQLFSCDFEGSTQTFYQLAEADAPRGRVWLGVANAWTGAAANAERDLTGVVSDHAASEHAPNARFYLTQLALWNRRAGPAQRYLDQLRQNSPDYLGTLDTRAQNWLSRRTHLMRAYFTFDTLARLGRMTHANAAAAQDTHADEALALLQQNPGACAEQVARLASARQQGAGDRAAFAAATRDADGDGIPDQRDRCPNEGETRNGIADDDGCAEDTAAIEVVGNQIRIRNGFAINFSTGEDTVVNESSATIEQIAQLLANPQYAWIRRVRLDGHTDDNGEASSNLSLSQRRVRRVGAMLVSRGVPADKLTYGYYGEGRPIDSAQTDEARARNRRVELFIIDPPMFGGVRAAE